MSTREVVSVVRRKEKLSFVQVLIKAGGNINHRNILGNTALSLAKM